MRFDPQEQRRAQRRAERVAAENPARAGTQTGPLENFAAAWNSSAREMQASAWHHAMEDRYDTWIDELEDLTGQSFDNPITDEVNLVPGISSGFGALGLAEPEQDRITAFHEQVDKLRENNPDLPTFSSQEIERQVIQEFRDAAERERRTAYNASELGKLAGTAARFAGVMADTPNLIASLLTLPLGGIGGRASSAGQVAKSTPFIRNGVVRSMIGEAGIEAVVEALTLPGIDLLRDKLGHDPLTLREKAVQIGTAGAGGALIAGAARVGSRGGRVGTVAGTTAGAAAAGGLAGGEEGAAVGGGIGAFASILSALTGRRARQSLDQLGEAGIRVDPDDSAALRRDADTRDTSPFEATRQGDAEHVRRLDIADEYLRTGRIIDLPDPSLRNGVEVRADFARDAQLRAAISQDLPEIEPLARLLDDLRVQADQVAAQSGSAASVSARMATAQGFPAAIRVDPKAFEGVRLDSDPSAGAAIARFEQFLTEPAELRSLEKGQFLRIRRIDDDPNGRYLVAEFRRRKRKGREIGNLDFVRVADRAEVDRLRAASEAPGSAVQRVRGRTTLEGGQSAEPPQATEAASARIENADFLEPLIARTDDVVELDRAQVANRAQQSVTDQADDLERLLEAADVTISEAKTDAAGRAFGQEQVSARQRFDEIKSDEGALNEFRNCAGLA